MLDFRFATNHSPSMTGQQVVVSLAAATGRNHILAEVSLLGDEDKTRLGIGSMRFFIAGIMQGSHRDSSLHAQDYRGRLRMLLEQHFADAEVYDPLSDHANSLDYDDQLGREVFFRHNRLCREVEVVVAFVPEASMGTAIEMWEAHEHGRGAVIAISPLSHNWAVRFCSHVVYPDFNAFETDLAAGLLAKQISTVLNEKQTTVD